MLSIIIPTYQEEKLLGRLLKSIKSQTVQPDEIIVADNFSRDRTREIAKLHNCIVVDGGIPAEGRNSGAKIAKGDILLFLDADTVLTKPTFIENTLKAFTKRKLDIATTFLTFEKLTTKGILADLGFNTTKILNQFLLKHFKKIFSESGACILMKKELFERIGYFDEKIYLGEDADIFKRASKDGAKYGLIFTNLKTSDRRFQKLSTAEFTLTSILVVIGFFSRFLGFKDPEQILKKYEELYGPLGGE